MTREAPTGLRWATGGGNALGGCNGLHLALVDKTGTLCGRVGPHTPNAAADSVVCKTCSRLASKPQGLAGLRSTRWDVERSTWVSVYDGEPAAMDTEGGRWQTVCEKHGSICSHDTLALARLHYMGDPAEWCEDCRGIERDPYDVTSGVGVASSRPGRPNRSL